MAQDMLMLAVRDWLRQNLGFAGLPPEMIDVMGDRRPAPRAGDWFCAISEGPWRFDSSLCRPGQGLAEVLGIEVTLSRKVGFAPFDRIGVEAVAQAKQGLLAVARQVLLAIDDNEQIRLAANAAIGTTANGFLTPLWFEDGGRSTPQGPSWWSARSGKAGNKPAGLSRTLTFGGAQRLQKREEAT